MTLRACCAGRDPHAHRLRDGRAAPPSRDPDRPARAAAPVAATSGDAYYHFSVAQMHARAGRMPEAIAELREAIKRDPNTAALWTQLAQWLVAHQQPAEAFAAAQKAVELEPDNTSRLPDAGRALPRQRAGCPRRRPRSRR